MNLTNYVRMIISIKDIRNWFFLTKNHIFPKILKTKQRFCISNKISLREKKGHKFLLPQRRYALKTFFAHEYNFNQKKNISASIIF